MPSKPHNERWREEDAKRAQRERFPDHQQRKLLDERFGKLNRILKERPRRKS